MGRKALNRLAFANQPINLRIMYISEIQKRLMNVIGVSGNHNGIVALAIEHGANPKEMTDTYHLALWFEGAPAEVKHKLLRLLDNARIYEHGLRICDGCGRFMTEGYILSGMDYYACSEECAIKQFGTKEDLDVALQDYPDDNFWTEWYQEL